MDYSSENVEEFVKLVRDMRAKQKAFFANRSQNSMMTAKAAEQQVDGWLNHWQELQAHRSIGLGGQNAMF
jgi:dihydroxyacetone kinase-like predicted kinase